MERKAVTKTLQNVPLGEKSTYSSKYDPSLLFAIPRSEKRNEINIISPLPFYGYDIWNAYEVSWLNQQGKPVVAIATFIIPCTSINIIESKSFKLYLNSFNNTRFNSSNDVYQLLEKDLSTSLQSKLEITLSILDISLNSSIESLPGKCIDNLDVSCDTYTINPNFLSCEDTQEISETLYSNLLKSNCLVTNQPDWGSISISYTGKPINKAGLLKYIVSFRDHNEFHEQCVERIFMDIMQQCQPKKLTVYARYTRRGGLDINPIRSTNKEISIYNQRLIRQ